eukprot:TRINITY_DN1899_c0_g1_i2.p1 TRINITY_DN1899_c0_g1~~TRINITY_DN1899_c0_g1_i2.p1  ORF type:complete len:145 (-),score=9.49 TRINITY_DN1899_c0_g1_i2:394-828(-)
MAWIDKIGKSKKQGGSRILVVSSHRIFTVKKLKKGLDPRKQAHLLYLEQCTIAHNEVTVLVDDGQEAYLLKFRYSQPRKILEAIFKSYSKITYDFPDKQLCQFIEDGDIMNVHLFRKHPLPEASTFEKFCFYFLDRSVPSIKSK